MPHPRTEEMITRMRAGESMRSLARETGIDRSTLEHWKAKADRAEPPTQKNARILIYDIETLPNKGYFFDVFSDRGIALEFIEKPKSIVTIAYKFIGDQQPKVLRANTPYEDADILAKFLPIWESANYGVAHFGRGFDMPFIAARLMANNLPPLPPLPQIDTYQLAKRHFGRSLNSNKLDHLGDVLGLGRKNKTNANLWVGCAQGKRKALKEMAMYNAQDVTLLEKVFVKLLPHVKSTLNMNLLTDEPIQRCKSCGSDKLELKGFELLSSTLRHRFQCLACLAWSTIRPKKRK
ncbi:hypothetical protein BH10PLA2_BH10PLA2_25380 [soil metagenome]